MQYWRTADWVLGEMMNYRNFDWGPMKVVCDKAKDTKRIFFPNGACMIYDTLDWKQLEDRQPGYVVKTRYGWKSIYGAMLTQNVCEAVSRLIMTQGMLRLKYRGFRALNSTHDELLFLIPKDGRSEELRLQTCIGEMTVEPTWLPGLPLAAEGSLGSRYEK